GEYLQAEFLEFWSAVIDDRHVHRPQDALGDRGRTGDLQEMAPGAPGLVRHLIAPCVNGSLRQRLTASTARCVNGSLLQWLASSMARCVNGSLAVISCATDPCAARAEPANSRVQSRANFAASSNPGNGERLAFAAPASASRP